MERHKGPGLLNRGDSVGDLLTMRKLKNTDATSHLHIDQRNTPSRADAHQVRVIYLQHRRKIV